MSSTSTPSTPPASAPRIPCSAPMSHVPHAGEAGFISKPRARCLDCDSWSAGHHRLACRYMADLKTTTNPFTKKETLLEADEPNAVGYWSMTQNASSPTSSSDFLHLHSFIPPLFTHQYVTV